MDEKLNDSSQKSYPVKVVAMRIDWFLVTPAGKKFLNAILHYKNLEYYRITTIQMIIEYLFSKFKSVILFAMLPLYLF